MSSSPSTHRTAASGTANRLPRATLLSALASPRERHRGAIRSTPHSTQCTLTLQAFRDTDWSQVIALYDQLLELDPSPIVRLNRAVAVAELDGPEVALSEIKGLPLKDYHAFHAA